MSDIPKNIEQFNFAALAILDELYGCFPMPAPDFHPGAVCSNRFPKDASFESSWEIDNIADATLTWLASEGFVTIGSLATGSRGFGDVRLTLKGLALLGAVPEPVRGEPPKQLSQKIREAMSTGARYAGSEAFKAIVGDVIKFGVAYAKESTSSLPGFAS